MLIRSGSCILKHVLSLPRWLPFISLCIRAYRAPINVPLLPSLPRAWVSCVICTSSMLSILGCKFWSLEIKSYSTHTLK